MMRTILALRRGAGATSSRWPHVAACHLDGAETITWERNGRMNRIPACFMPPGRPRRRRESCSRIGTDQPRKVAVTDERLGRQLTAQFGIEVDRQAVGAAQPQRCT